MSYASNITSKTQTLCSVHTLVEYSFLKHANLCHCFYFLNQVVISNVGQLLQTLKSVEEDERRGIRSLELAANYCREQAKLLPSSKDPEGLLTPNSSRKSGPRSISVASGSSSLIARYLAPDDLARAAGGPVQSAVSKAILANNTQIQRDIVQTSSATRDAVTDLVAAAKVRV